MVTRIIGQVAKGIRAPKDGRHAFSGGPKHVGIVRINRFVAPAGHGQNMAVRRKHRISPAKLSHNDRRAFNLAISKK